MNFHFNHIYFVALPIPNLLISPSATNFLNDPSIELTLNDGQSSLISCLINLPSSFKVAAYPGIYKSKQLNQELLNPIFYL